MAPATPARYPLPDSLGAFLFEASEEALISRFVPIDSSGVLPRRILSELGDYLDVQRELTELFPRESREPRNFRKVPSGRLFGSFDYFEPEERLFLRTYRPPLVEYSTLLHLLLFEEPGEPLGDRLVELGFPVPVEEPTVLIGRPPLEEGAVLIYAPGPEGLVELVYRIRTDGNRATVLVTAVRPPEPRFGELELAYRERFAWDGTLVFEDRASLQRDDGTLYPPGSKVHRSI